jgi:hypothetical protein
MLPLQQAAASTTQDAPWWFAGTVGLAGIVVGVIIKSVIDARATRARNRREDELRFIQDKRVAYSDLLAACGEVADVEHEGRELAARRAASDARVAQEFEAGRPARVDDYDDRLEGLESRRTGAYRELNRVAAIVDLIGPEPVSAAANAFVSRAHHPHHLARRVEAEAAYIDAARHDLGYPPTSHLLPNPYEDYIPFDHPDSGL